MVVLVMRLKSILAAMAIMLVFGPAATQSAFADGGWRKGHQPGGWDRTRGINHHIYYPRYRHVYKVHHHTDPYAYHYEPRRYYRHSSSHYWVSAHRMRHRHRHHHGAKYRYRPAWGYSHHGSHDRHRRGRH